MERREFLFVGLFGAGVAVGCSPTAKVLRNDKPDMVGSHTAGAETYKPLVEESVAKLLARQKPTVQAAGVAANPPMRVCFVGLENKSDEELGSFRDQLIEIIDEKITNCAGFQTISRRYVDAGLKESRLRAEDLFIPAKQKMFQGALEQAGQPFDVMLFARLTSGTTRANSDTQKDYLLSLELVNIHTGDHDKESASIRKSYHTSKINALLH